MEEVIRFFLNNTIHDINSKEYNLSYIKFVFNHKTLMEMSKYNDQTVRFLKDIKDNYEKGLKNDEDIYIKVDDSQKFFSLLNKIVLTYGKRKHKGIRNSFNIMRSIWLRMSASDINDVNNFLRRQLAFLNNDNILPYHQELFKEYSDIGIYYQNVINKDWFETNNNVTFSFIRSDIDKDDSFPTDYCYNLPSIHYALNKENDECICYIYGIQNLSKEQDKIIKEKIKPLRKKLQNKYVSPDFVLVLKLFIDFLSDNDIYTIKVPLLQVFNYPYHESLSESIQKAYFLYDNKDELERKYNDGSIDDIVLDYIHDKKMYEKFVGKADLISKNKTERLINTFQVSNEKFNNIEFLNDPFIQDDYLIIKINKQHKKDKRKCLNKYYSENNYIDVI